MKRASRVGAWWLVAGVLSACPVGPAAVDGGVDAGAFANGLTLVLGQLLTGGGASTRLVLARLTLSNQTTAPLSLLPAFFKVHLSTGVEFPGTTLETAQATDPCPSGDVSVGATVTCSIGFQVDLSATSTSITGVGYTLTSGQQWLVQQAIPTCEQCGRLDGCIDFHSSNQDCGGCGVACSADPLSPQACLSTVCVPVVAVVPTAATCAATCAPKRCAAVGVLLGCSVS
jgi:hypothetical protein